MHLTPTRGAPGTVITFTTVINLAIDFRVDGVVLMTRESFFHSVFCSPHSVGTLEGGFLAMGQLVSRSWPPLGYH